MAGHGFAHGEVEAVEVGAEAEARVGAERAQRGFEIPSVRAPEIRPPRKIAAGCLRRGALK